MTVHDVGPQLRAALAVRGATTISGPIRWALVDQAKGIGELAAETAWLALVGLPDPGQAAVDAIGAKAVEALGALLTSCFAEFGQANHADLATAIARAEDGFFNRIAVLCRADDTGGRA